MVGRIKISRQADAVRHLFMDLGKNARKIKACWFCGSALPTMKLANQGYLRGHHAENCYFEKLAIAAENCILRDSNDMPAKAAAEGALAAEIEAFFQAMSKHTCPFPVCQYTSGHRVECPLHAFERETEKN